MFQFKRFTVLLAAALLVVNSNSVSADEESDTVKLNDQTKRISYSLGYQIGGDFKRQGVEIDEEAVIKGIEDALSDTKPLLPRKAMLEILVELKRNIVIAQREQTHTAPRKNRREAELEYVAEGREFMNANESKPGVIKTKSGLQYKVIEPGTGKTPGPEDSVTVRYRGTLINGNVFDTSGDDGETATFKLGDVIPGWTEGLQLMKEGGKIQLFVPHALAYRDRGPLGHRTLIFDVELVSVDDKG